MIQNTNTETIALMQPYLQFSNMISYSLDEKSIAGEYLFIEQQNRLLE